MAAQEEAEEPQHREEKWNWHRDQGWSARSAWQGEDQNWDQSWKSWRKDKEKASKKKEANAEACQVCKKIGHKMEDCSV